MIIALGNMIRRKSEEMKFNFNVHLKNEREEKRQKKEKKHLNIGPLQDLDDDIYSILMDKLEHNLNGQ